MALHWSIGWFADSAALQWVGAVLGLFLLGAKGIALLKEAERQTSFTSPEAAKAWLDRHFARACDDGR